MEEVRAGMLSSSLKLSEGSFVPHVTFHQYKQLFLSLIASIRESGVRKREEHD